MHLAEPYFSESSERMGHGKGVVFSCRRGRACVGVMECIFLVVRMGVHRRRLGELASGRRTDPHFGLGATLTPQSASKSGGAWRAWCPLALLL